MTTTSITEAGLRAMILAAFPGLAITSEILSKIKAAAGWSLERARSEHKKIDGQITQTSAILRETRAKLVLLKAARPGDAEISRLMSEQERLEKNQALLTRLTADVGKKIGLGRTTPTEIADLGIAPIIIAGALVGIVIVIVILGTWVSALYVEATTHKKTADWAIASVKSGELTPEQAATVMSQGTGQWYEKLVAWAPYVIVGWFGLQLFDIYRPGAPARRR